MRRILLTLALSAALTPNVHAQTPPTPHAQEHAVRLIVSDGRTNTLTVLNTGTGEALASFGTPGRLSGLETGPGGTYAYAIHRDDHRVTVLHSGLNVVSHGDHNDLRLSAPHILTTLNTGQKPTHFVVHGPTIAVFNDGDGTVALLREELLGTTNDLNIIKVTQPDHGAPLIIGNVLLSGQLALNRADAYDLSNGKLLGRLPTCTALHGGTVLGNVALFGCKEGVQVITVNGQATQARMIPQPTGTPDGTRVGMFTHGNDRFTYADFGKGIARLTPGSAALTPIPLSGKPRKFLLTEDARTLAVLTTDGQLHAVDAATGRVRRSAALIAPFEGGEKTAIRPDLTLAGDTAYITSPDTGEVLEVRLSDLSVTRRLKVGGAPSFITATTAEGIQH